MLTHTLVQAYYLEAPFPVEKVPTQRISVDEGLKSSGVYVSQLLNYPFRGLVFEGGNSMRDLSDTVASRLVFLQKNNIAFNVLISDCAKRIYLFPQVLFFLMTIFLVLVSTFCSFVIFLCKQSIVLINFKSYPRFFGQKVIYKQFSLIGN